MVVKRMNQDRQERKQAKAARDLPEAFGWKSTCKGSNTCPGVLKICSRCPRAIAEYRTRAFMVGH